jgi:hypothetical protein
MVHLVRSDPRDILVSRYLTDSYNSWDVPPHLSWGLQIYHWLDLAIHWNVFKFHRWMNRV